MHVIYSDLEYGLPVKLRDHALNIKDDGPKSDVGREYHLQNMGKEVGPWKNLFVLFSSGDCCC